ncbi:hypothetical protein M9H77_15316 [Catharanthus roseus]|uniref:Uncharacterized protein n=1 Tax=Catharanthus roseus TaxID=4058 RepID=A0ACC0AZT8_CATRO|nr:hypothetical protein M9H77_15316 [Catharanthus roseus]
MAASPFPLPLIFSLIISSSSSNSFPPPFSVSFIFCSQSHYSCINQTMFLSVFFFTFSLLSISIFVFSLYSKSRRRHRHRHHGRERKETQRKKISYMNTENATSASGTSVDNQISAETDIRKTSGSDPDVLLDSLLLEMLPSDSPKWYQLLEDDEQIPELEEVSPGEEEEEQEEEKKKKRKKRGKKKRPGPNGGGGGGGEGEIKKEKEKLVCSYPFTTSCSATQKKIKQQYDQLVKSHESNGLTLAQVGQFVNCLVELRKELQQRSEAIQRKFTISKALLLKADRSNFERQRQQVCKLELEHKRLEEDAFVYNWLQQQIKLSPAYEKMLEVGVRMEMKAKSCEQAEDTEDEFNDISFEELLEQEKKDAFWQQRNAKFKSSV